MAEPAQVLEEIFTVIEGGKDLGDASKIVQFPSDNGQKVYKAVEMTQQGSNGTGLRYWAAAIASAGSRALSSGAIMLGMEVGVAGAAIAPALGLLTGYVLYNLSPEFWNGVATALIDAGETVKGKVVAYMNENGNLTFSEDTIEIYKNKFIEAGLFEKEEQFPEPESQGTITIRSKLTPGEMINYVLSHRYPAYPYIVTSQASQQLNTILETLSEYDCVPFGIVSNQGTPSWMESWGDMMEIVVFNSNTIQLGVSFNNQASRIGTLNCRVKLVNNTFLEYRRFEFEWNRIYLSYPQYPWLGILQNQAGDIQFASGIDATYTYTEGVQEGAEVPDSDPFPLKYPDWLPHDFPVVEGETIIKHYPLEYPDSLPAQEPYQGEAQNPNIENAPEPAIETIGNPANNPDEEVNPEDEPVVDPEPQPEPEPIPVPEAEPAPDPVEPDPPSPITPVIPVPAMPSTISSNRLFTVYNPSASQLDQLGAYLWDSDLIDILKKIWQNPLDGIISLTQVFVTPPTNGSHNIILGYLDSQVNAPVVSNQFVTVDCGTVNVDEICNNCLDYVPYTQLQLYLPFIGITEIDTNEFMAGSINVKYHVDVYTGSCLAEVKCTRSRDLANGTILYTFNGNCSQQLPLTSGDTKGVLTALIGAAGAGLSIASGGEFGMLAGARMVSSNIAKGMLHVSHSGNLSANSGIMGQKKPYLIINRERAYTATSYNKMYGFPANKMIYPGNHSGFVRIKSGRLKTFATEAEKNEIMELLEKGVIM